MSSISESYKAIAEEISESRFRALHPRDVTLIAVSKTQPLQAIEELYRLGHRDFGENYAQELLEKAGSLEQRGMKGIRWHFIGHLQSKKAKSIAPFLSSVHSVASEKLAIELGKCWTSLGRSGELSIFIQVNIDNESTKSGILPSEAPEFARRVSTISGLRIQGLMCIPAPELDPRPRFVALRELEKKCHPYSCGMLSMGMSSDFQVAIQEGSTHVRVGTALFGSRQNL